MKVFIFIFILSLSVRITVKANNSEQADIVKFKLDDNNYHSTNDNIANTSKIMPKQEFLNIKIKKEI